MITIAAELNGLAAVGILEMDGLKVTETPQELKVLISDLAEELANKYKDDLPGKIPAVRNVRRIFHKAGIDPTRYRPSSESLLRRVVKGKGLYIINSVVDVVNYFSLRQLCPMGLFDADLLTPP